MRVILKPIGLITVLGMMAVLTILAVQGLRFQSAERSAAIPTRLSTPSAPSAQTAAIPAPSRHGLTATYYDNDAFRGEPLIQRVDPRLVFVWGKASPGPGIAPGSPFAVRWEGTLTPPADGAYRFFLTAQGSARLFINNTLILERWEGPQTNERAMAEWNRPIESNHTVVLKQGEQVPIRVEYYKSHKLASLALNWSYTDQNAQMIPTQYLAPLER